MSNGYLRKVYESPLDYGKPNNGQNYRGKELFVQSQRQGSGRNRQAQASEVDYNYLFHQTQSQGFPANSSYPQQRAREGPSNHGRPNRNGNNSSRFPREVNRPKSNSEWTNWPDSGNTGTQTYSDDSDDSPSEMYQEHGFYPRKAVEGPGNFGSSVKPTRGGNKSHNGSQMNRRSVTPMEPEDVIFAQHRLKLHKNKSFEGPNNHR